MPPSLTPPHLPDFSDRRCHYIVICGRFGRDSQIPLDGFTAKGNWQFSEYRKSNASVRVHVGRTLPRDGGGPHFHVEMTTLGWDVLGEKEKPKVLSRAELNAIFLPLLGHEYSAKVTAFFSATKDELPAFIRYSMMPVQADGVELEMTSSFYSVRGAPVQTVRWRATDAQDRFEIALESKSKRPFDVNYFEELVITAEKSFGVFFHHGELE